MLLSLMLNNSLAQDSIYQLQAIRGSRMLIFSEGSAIVTTYLDSDKQLLKIRGQIKSINDSSIIVRKSAHRTSEIPLKSIVRFNKANNSVLRYVAFVAAGSLLIVAGGETLSRNISDEINSFLQPVEYFAIGTMAAAYYMVVPGIIDAACKKHYTANGWLLQPIKIKRGNKKSIFLHNY